MLILFDHGTPKGLIRALPGHTVHTAQAKGWDTLSNGALLKAAEEAGFDVLLTTDRRIRYQQNLSARRIAVVVLTGSTKWSGVRQHSVRRVRTTRGLRDAVSGRPRAETKNLDGRWDNGQVGRKRAGDSLLRARDQPFPVGGADVSR